MPGQCGCFCLRARDPGDAGRGDVASPGPEGAGNLSGSSCQKRPRSRGEWQPEAKNIIR